MVPSIGCHNTTRPTKTRASWDDRNERFGTGGSREVSIVDILDVYDLVKDENIYFHGSAYHIKQLSQRLKAARELETAQWLETSRRLETAANNVAPTTEGNAKSTSRTSTHLTFQRLRALPRELRDAIYEHIVVLPYGIVFAPHWTFHWSWGVLRYLDGYEDPIPELLHLEEHVREAMDKDIYHEIITAFYQLNTFSLPDFVYFREFFETDPHGTGIVPGALVRSVEIVLNWRYLVRDSGRFDCCSGYLVMRGDEPNPTSPEEACAIISAILETFVPQERRKLLTLTLTVPCVRYELPHDPLVVLGNLVLTLKEMGFHIYVMCAEVDEMCVRWKLHEKCYQWPGNDWTHLFDVSKEEWDERVRKKEIFKRYVPNDDQEEQVFRGSEGGIDLWWAI